MVVGPRQQSELVQLIEKQVTLRNTSNANIYYQKQLSGTFEKDVAKVVRVLRDHKDLVPNFPAWKALCDNFEKGRCDYGSSCYYAHGNVIQTAIRRFRNFMPKEPFQSMHELLLSSNQSQRLLYRLRQVARPRNAEEYGLKKTLPLHLEATIDFTLSSSENTPYQTQPNTPKGSAYQTPDLAPQASPLSTPRSLSLGDTPYHTQPTTPKGSAYQTPDLAPQASPLSTPRSLSLEETPYHTQPTTPKGSAYQTPDLAPQASPLSTPRSLSLEEPFPVPKASETPKIQKSIGFDPNNPFDILGVDSDLEANES